ncbi:hypothetical protein A2924_02205 [Candidatus Giovannonibacteria bacterium RIFCSPLOWO2_01_FULL_44_16]|uniref:HD/PDEase domain-containing protein n=2 Tax=Candidatus Giovannoniibacteriota TaxID=1752738 RepID=A0A1F5X5N9_9BACT|nr:MAG: hypothetical protein A2924_02205 [Candidatus Giovannonibacteria bacterium RIFCSPLOWO2_01_FULL_44_16]
MGAEGGFTMNRKQFFEKVRASGINDSKDLLLIQRAYWLAKETHRIQHRDGGERYFNHPRRVSCLLMKYHRASAEIVSAALLHDTIEDGYLPADIVRALLGDTVADIVEKLTKYTVVYDNETGAVKGKHKKHPDIYFSNISSDGRACTIKFADRLDNLQSMGVWTMERQARYLKETEEKILPLWQCNTDFPGVDLMYPLREKFEKCKLKLLA